MTKELKDVVGDILSRLHLTDKDNVKIEARYEVMDDGLSTLSPLIKIEVKRN